MVSKKPKINRWFASKRRIARTICALQAPWFACFASIEMSLETNRHRRWVARLIDAEDDSIFFEKRVPYFFSKVLTFFSYSF
jgi:hypothetical protein